MRPPPPPYLMVWMTAPPPRSPPYLKIWIRYCGLLAHALPMLVFKIFLTPSPPAPLCQGLDDRSPPRSPPYLKVWFRHCRLLALLMLVYRIWRVNCDKQDWKDEEMGQKLKNSVGWKCPNYFCRRLWL